MFIEYLRDIRARRNAAYAQVTRDWGEDAVQTVTTQAETKKKRVISYTPEKRRPEATAGNPVLFEFTLPLLQATGSRDSVPGTVDSKFLAELSVLVP